MNHNILLQIKAKENTNNTLLHVLMAFLSLRYQTGWYELDYKQLTYPKDKGELTLTVAEKVIFKGTVNEYYDVSMVEPFYVSVFNGKKVKKKFDIANFKDFVVKQLAIDVLNGGQDAELFL